MRRGRARWLWLVWIVACGGPQPTSVSTPVSSANGLASTASDDGPLEPTRASQGTRQTPVTHQPPVTPSRPVTPAAPAPSAPSAPGLPYARHDRAGPTSAPELAAAEAAFARLEASLVSPVGPFATTEDAVHALIAQLQSASVAAEAVGLACAPYEDAPAPLGALARTLHADALDLLASRVASATLPFPEDLERRIGHPSPEVIAEIRARYQERIAEVLVERAAQIFCTATLAYRLVLVLDPESPRAVAQLADYRDELVRRCMP